jgi:hypothetical protein
MQYNGDNIKEIWEWAQSNFIYGPTPINTSAYIINNDGIQEVKINDWIVIIWRGCAKQENSTL